jgi:hypothetical protein
MTLSGSDRRGLKGLLQSPGVARIAVPIEGEAILKTSTPLRTFNRCSPPHRF